MELIHLDVQRTFPTLGIFQEGGPYYDLLLDLLCAYVCYRPDVGYVRLSLLSDKPKSKHLQVQSMSFIAGILLLNLDRLEAFVAFANLMNRPLQRTFFGAIECSLTCNADFIPGLRQPQMTYYFIAYDHFLNMHLPSLHAYFDSIDVRPDLYLIEWYETSRFFHIASVSFCRIYTMYAKSLPLDIVVRIWDVYFRDGDDVLFQVAVGESN